MILYQNIYVKIEFIEEYNLIKQIFLPETFGMTEEDFKKSQLVLLDCVKAKKPNIVLANLHELLFPISVDMQEWVINHIFNEGEQVGVRKVAHLVSADFKVQLSIEMTVDDYQENVFENRFFHQEEEAMNWLLA